MQSKLLKKSKTLLQNFLTTKNEEGEITDEDSLEDGELFEFQDDDRDEDYIPKKELRRQLRKKQRMQEKEFCVATTSDDNDDDDIVIIAVNGVKVKK